MKIVKVDKSGIEFDNGLVLRDYHEQDCCEDVYADFENMQVKTNIGQNSLDITTLNFNEDILKQINLEDGVGFSIVSKEGVELFVSCYDIQNGYYSHNLELIYNNERLDITDCTNDSYY